MPRTRIDPLTQAELLRSVEFVLAVAADGGIFGDRTYELLDPAGLSILAEYIWHYFFEDFAPFIVKNVLIPLQGAASQKVRIALVGDWGSGDYSPAGPAGDVMSQIQKLQPDYVIHLGDTYYSGTANEEKTNLLAGWGGVSGKSFTLNSNHEMYDGGFGYFKTSLGSSLFGAQQGASYFALQYGDAAHGGPWTILALDTGYWSTSALVMDGSICDQTSSRHGSTAQLDFISHLGLSPQKVIVLTHHNPISYDGSSVVQDSSGNDLLSQVGHSLGEPAAWYGGTCITPRFTPCRLSRVQ